MGKLHNDDFKRDAVRMALNSGLTRKGLAADLGVGFSTLSAWIHKHRSEIEGSPAPMHDGGPAERLRLRRRMSVCGSRTVISRRRGRS